MNQEGSKQNEVDGMKKGADSTGASLQSTVAFSLKVSKRVS